MSDANSTEPLDFDSACELVSQMRQQIEQVVIGQRTIIDQVLCGLLAAGHVLIEGVPGLGKTLLVKALANTFGGQFARIQFTPDLMPSDVTGHAMYDMKTEQFRIRKGPVFTHLLLADEINRAPAKTQAALLEVMQEKHITIEGKAFAAPHPFMVLATQNPIEQEGTYPLPEAELDRFMLKTLIDYPALSEEVALVQQVTTNRASDMLDVASVQHVASAEQVQALQRLTAQIAVDDAVFEYAVRLVQATRQWHAFTHGAGPRGSIALIRLARAQALLQGHPYVTPGDVKHVALPALRHRVAMTADMDIEGVSVDRALLDVLDDVAAPRA